MSDSESGTSAATPVKKKPHLSQQYKANYAAQFLGVISQSILGESYARFCFYQVLC